MKLFLSLLVMVLSVVGLFFLLKPSKPRAPRRTALKPKPQPPAPAEIQAPAVPKSLPASSAKNSQEEIQQEVQNFAQRFPRQTAQVLQTWIKNKK